MSVAMATCMAVGKVSFEDCPRLTWSLGWTGLLLPRSPPASSMARLAMTSLAFMFVCVPDPVCQMKSGKCSSSIPLATSSAARTTSGPTSGSSRPAARFTWAQASLRMPMAWTMSMGMRSARGSPMEKWWIERWVWAPQ